MKLFYFASFDLKKEKGGGTSHVEGIVYGFHNIGWEVTLFSAFQNHKPGTEEYPFRHIMVKKKTLAIKDVLLMQFRLLWVLLFLREKPDLVYFRHSPIMLAPVLYAKLRGIPYFCELNGLRETETSYMKLLPFLLWLENWMLKHSTGIICVTEELKKYFCERTKLDGRKFFVIHNGADVNIWPPGDLKKGRTKYQKGAIQIGFLGHFQERQGVETILRSLPAIRLNIGDVHFILGGTGPLEETYRQITQEMKITEYVHFMGYIEKEEIPVFLSYIDIAVAPYTSYFTKGPTGLSPIKIFTYLSCERIVVTCDVSAMHKFKECDSIFFAKPDEPEDYARVITEILQMPEEKRRELGRTGRRYVLSGHTWNHVAQKTVHEMMKRIGMQ